MEEGWVKIFSAAQSFVVEMFQDILEENDIPSIVMNKTDSMHLHLTNGEVELYVRKEEVVLAKRLIEKNSFE